MKLLRTVYEKTVYAIYYLAGWVEGAIKGSIWTIRTAWRKRDEMYGLSMDEYIDRLLSEFRNEH